MRSDDVSFGLCLPLGWNCLGWLMWQWYWIHSFEIIATWAGTTPNDGLVRESSRKSPDFRLRNKSNLPTYIHLRWNCLAPCCIIFHYQITWNNHKFLEWWKTMSVLLDISLDNVTCDLVKFWGAPMWSLLYVAFRHGRRLYQNPLDILEWSIMSKFYRSHIL